MAQPAVLRVEEMVRALTQWKRGRWGGRDPLVGEMVGVLHPHRFWRPGVVGRDVSLAEVLDMAGRLQREAHSPLIAEIAHLFLLPDGPEGCYLDWGKFYYQLHRDYDVNKVNKLRFDGMAQIEAAVCVALVALSPADSAVLMIKESCIRAVACALFGLTAARDPSNRTFYPLAAELRRSRTEKEVEAVCAALASNLNVTFLDLFGKEWFCPTAGGMRHLSNMLRTNSTLQSLLVTTESRTSWLASTLRLAPIRLMMLRLRHASAGSASLKDLSFVGPNENLDVDELLEMVGHLGALQSLDLDVKLSGRTGTTGHLVGTPSTVSSTSNLQELRLGRSVGPNAPHLIRCLSAPGTLETLIMYRHWDGESCEALFRLLTPPTAATSVINGHPPPALPLINSLKHLHLDNQYCNNLQLVMISREVDALAGMIVANKVLLTLHLSSHFYSADEWAGQIIPALAENHTLRALDLSECRGVDGDRVYDAMVRMLQRNISLEKIILEGTPLERGGKGAAIQAQLQQNKEYRAALAGLPTMPVKSCRLVLCGYPLAGKTTLCETMVSGIDTTKIAPPTREQVLASRTRGFEVKRLPNAPAADLRISVWDFAGQKQYYALHDYVFPAANSSSLFLFVYSPVRHCHDPANHSSQFQYKSKTEFEDEFTYWLKFIASNARPGPDQPAKPTVLIAITFSDALSRQGLKKRCLHEVREVVDRLRQQFEHVIQVPAEPFYLDARSRTGVDSLLNSVRQHFRGLVSRLPQVPTICEHVRLALETWSIQNQGMPIMPTVEFRELCQTVCEAVRDSPGVSPLHSTFLQNFMADGDWWKVMASYLKDTGELIYFEDMDFIVVSPHWLGRGVLGHVMESFGFGGDFQDRPREDIGERGLMSKKNLEMLLKDSLDEVKLPEQQRDLIKVECLIQLMLKLGLCFENRNPQNEVVGYFLPVFFDIHQGEQHPEGQTQLQWPSRMEDSEDHIFAGLRLQCGDLACTFLKPGFFPRLQVMLYNHFLEKGWIAPQKQACVNMDVNVFGIATHGLDILVEYSGSIGFYVDILARSTLHPTQSMNFLLDNVVKPIRTLCASDEGCMGVALVEGIVRQECVKLRTLCRYRKDESVLLEALLLEVRKSEQEGHEYYSHQWCGVADKEAGQQPILSPRIECAILLDGHIILGQKHDIEKAKEKAKVRDIQEVTEDCYPDNNVKQEKPRGTAVLISMEEYEKENRLGGQVDRGRLESLAESLCLEVVVLLDLSARDLRKAIIDIAKNDIKADDECFVCFVNAHGGTADNGAQYLVDREGAKVFLLNDIVDPFRKCKNLFGKPKIFFVNMCRGTLKLGSAHGSGAEQKVPLQWSEGLEVPYVGEHSDCLIVFATSEHAVSMRHKERGTSFVSELVRAFNNKRNIMDVHSIIRLVTYYVVNVEQPISGYVTKFSQCPVVIHSLTKSLYWRRSGRV